LRGGARVLCCKGGGAKRRRAILGDLSSAFLKKVFKNGGIFEVRSEKTQQNQGLEMPRKYETLGGGIFH